jgi:CRISPR-associated endonuclease/helicase Cas3
MKRQQPALPACWPHALDALGIWAKSPVEGEYAGEMLSRHTWEVLSRLSELHQLRLDLPAQFGQPEFWSRLYWVCLLHDLGKCMTAFQHRLRKALRESGVGRTWQKHRHEVFSLAFVDWLFPEPGETRSWIIAGIVSHHRDRGDIEQGYPLDDHDQLASHLGSVSEQVYEAIYDWLNECTVAWAKHLSMPVVEQPLVLRKAQAVQQVMVAGSTSIIRALEDYARWSRNLERRNAFTPAELLLRGLITQADHTASAHAGRVRALDCRAEALKSVWEAAANEQLRDFALYDHQRQCESAKSHALLVAPTGSGKTEAALLWASAQTDAPRLFYTLPYQASMNAMWARLSSTFPKRDVEMQHGRGLLALYRLLMQAEPNPAKAAQQARWRQNLARLHHAPVQVFSPYQMLKAMYRLKGYEGMIADFQNAAFVFDEIHAYEAGRLALIVETMRYLRTQHGARFFVMSATFPSLIRRRLEDAIGDVSFIRAEDKLYANFCRHELHLQNGDLLEPAHWSGMIDVAKSGKSVLVCVNTVGRAQDAFERVKHDLPDAKAVLLHGRLNMRDRSSREEMVRAFAGSTSASRQPVVLIATQVVEVSLDIDLDVIFTDPAPLEALVQRFGRINRRRKIKPAAPVHVFTQPVVNKRPYPENLVLAALNVLRRQDGKLIQEDQVGEWLDEIYTGDIAETWAQDYAHAQHEFRTAIVERLRPFQSEPQLEDLFYKAFDGVEVLPACLQEEYNTQKEQDPILAQELMVPLRYNHLGWIKSKGRLVSSNYPIIVDVPYHGGDDGIGLDLSVLR